MAENQTPRGDGQSLSDREPVSVPPSQVSVKTVATVCLVVLGIALAAWLILHSMLAITVTITSALLAVALNRGVEFLEEHGVGRKLGIAIVMTGVLLLAGSVIWLVAPTAAAQVEQLANRAPDFLERLRSTEQFSWLDRHLHVSEKIDEAQNGDTSSGLGQAAITAVGGVAAGVVAIITVLFMVVFMLAFGGSLMRGLLAESLPAHRQRYEKVLGKIYRSVGGYLNGLGVIALLNATLMTVFLAIIRVPFFIPLGVLSGLGSLIPLLGATLSGFVIAMVALVSGGVWSAAAVTLFVIIYQQFENHAVAPMVYRRTVQVNPLVTLLGIIFLTELAGVVGAFLAVPIMAAAQIILRELFLLRRERLNLPLRGDVAQTRWRPFWRRRPA